MLVHVCSGLWRPAGGVGVPGLELQVAGTPACWELNQLLYRGRLVLLVTVLSSPELTVLLAVTDLVISGPIFPCFVTPRFSEGNHYVSSPVG